MKIAGEHSSRALKELKSIGLLLMSDARLPNVASLVAGEPISGSWWSHARAHDVYNELGRLADHKDVIFTKLVSGKVTLVHRKLWLDLVAIATAQEDWQLRDLSAAAKHLWHLVRREGAAQSDHISWPKRLQSVKTGKAIRELETRLLIHTEEFHSQSGSHAKAVETWQHWANRVGFEIDSKSVAISKNVFETLVSDLNEQYGGKGCLRWQDA